MDFKEALKSLENNDEFKKWMKKNKDYYLSHGFTLFESKNVQEDWEMGYYSEEKDNIVTFKVGDDVSRNPPSKVFKEEKRTILPIEIAKVNIDVSEVMKKANELQEKKYSVHVPLKRIVILQHLPIGQVWNITYVTQTFQTLNMKFDSENGKVVEHKLISIIEKMQPGGK